MSKHSLRKPGDQGDPKGYAREKKITQYSTAWVEKDGIVSFPVLTTGITGPTWTSHFKEKNMRMTEDAQSVVWSRHFTATCGNMTNVVIIPGRMLTDKTRTTNGARSLAGRMKLSKPSLELACIIRKEFDDDHFYAMGVGPIIVMHRPVLDRDGYPCMLAIDTILGGCIHTVTDVGDYIHPVGAGFVFVESIEKWV